MENQNPKENKRKTFVLLVIALIAVVAMIAGATYAYFQAQQGTGQSSDVNVTTGTTDNLNFNISDLDVTRTDIVDEDQSSEVPITINANMNNFTDKNTSLGDGVTATATLIANDATNEAEGNYYVYLNISKNELQYSSYKRNNPLEPDIDNKNTLVFKTPEEKSDAELGDEYSPIPELYLTIKKNGTEITSGVTIKDTELTHVEGILVDPNNEVDLTDKTLGGFDITETKGLIKIENQQTINVEDGTDNNTKTDTWEIIVTFMNLGTDQNLNTGKKLTGKVIIQKDEYVPTLAELCTGEKASECFTKNYKKDKAIIYHNLANANEISLPNASKVANDDSYRYSGSNDIVHNYICFGGDCSNNPIEKDKYKNLYRVIGFFKNDSDQYEMKIIKADAATKEDLGEGTFPDSAYRSDSTPTPTYYKGKLTSYGSYAWNDTAGIASSNNNVNMWAESNLNTKNLNGTYYDAIDPTYKSMVVEHKWEVGGFYRTFVDAKAVYDLELGTNKLTSSSNGCYTQGNMTTRQCNQANDLTYSANVGLMYVSDYMYGTLPEFWITNDTEYDQEDVKNNDWLYLGIIEWTISRNSNHGASGDGTYARVVYNTGQAHVTHSVYNSNDDSVRPVLYLTSDVKIISGSGTDSDPFKLSL